MYKARFARAIQKRNPLDKHAWEHTDLLYSYRGHEYIITVHNNGYTDAPLRFRHEEAQREIDRKIENESKPIPEWKYEGSAQEAFDMFYDYVNGEE